MGLSKRLRPLGMRSVEEIAAAQITEQRWRDYRSGKTNEFLRIDSATDGRVILAVQTDLFSEKD